MSETTVNGEPVPETAGNTSARWENTPNRHAYCDAEIARLRGELERAGRFPGFGVVAVPAGEVVAFGFAMERAQETIAMLGEDLIRQRARAQRAEAELAKIRDLAESWAGRAPARRTIAQEFTMSPRDAVSADCGRCILGILDEEPEPGGEHAEPTGSAS